ncbi:MAG: hypothetical protein ACRCZF_07795, partial [Gemmataceae bacterium]
MRRIAAVIASTALATSALGQTNTLSGAAPPDPKFLQPLNLRTTWASAVPIDGPRDGIAMAQVAPGNQLFIQTKAGMLVAMNMVTGDIQWTARYTTAYAPVMPLAITDKYVFAVNVIHLYCLQRYTGIVEYASEMPITASNGPVADDEAAYVTLGSGRVTAFLQPTSLRMPDKALVSKGAFGNLTKSNANENPADTVAKRYPGGGRKPILDEEAEDQLKIRVGSSVGSGTLQRTPSLAALPSVTPPYSIFDERGKYIVKSESVGVVHSLRRPYALKDPTAGVT